MPAILTVTKISNPQISPGDPCAGTEPQTHHKRLHETEVGYGIELHAERQKKLDFGGRQMAIKIPALLLTSLGPALGSFCAFTEPHSRFLACKMAVRLLVARDPT